MNETVDIRTITVEIQVEVTCRRYKTTYGADADGNRGELITECEMVKAECLERVPAAVATWAEATAAEQWQKEYA